MDPTSNPNAEGRPLRRRAFRVMRAVVCGLLLLSAAFLALMRGLTSTGGDSEVPRTRANVALVVERVRELPVTLGPMKTEDIVPPSRGPFASMVGPDNTLRHAFNGTMTVFGEARRFKITLATIPQQMCVRLLSADPGNGLIDVRSATQGPVGGWPFTPVNAASNCRSVYDTVTLTYLR